MGSLMPPLSFTPDDFVPPQPCGSLFFHHPFHPKSLLRNLARCRSSIVLLPSPELGRFYYCYWPRGVLRRGQALEDALDFEDSSIASDRGGYKYRPFLLAPTILLLFLLLLLLLLLPSRTLPSFCRLSRWKSELAAVLLFSYPCSPSLYAFEATASSYLSVVVLATLCPFNTNARR